MKRFTLIELLVVIATMAVLISLLLPALSKARLKTKVGVCLSQSRQIGTAALVYATENNGRFPVYQNDAGLNDGFRWVGKGGTASPEITSGGFQAVEKRALNKYLGYTSNDSEVPLALCPLKDNRQGLNQQGGTFSQEAHLGSSYTGAVRWDYDDLGENTISQIQNSSTMAMVLTFSAFITIKYGTSGHYKATWNHSDVGRYPITFVDGHTSHLTLIKGTGLQHSMDMVTFRNNY